MIFREGYIYHVFNQGNNRRKIFFERENYLFFLRKIETFILPYTDILAWCLMPNHFHLMILIRHTQITDHDPIEERKQTHPMTQSHRMGKRERNLSQSIAIMLRSYTRAINKQRNLTGSLFRQHTKAQCLNCLEGVAPAWILEHGVTKINISNPEIEYPQVCFNYIHQNPVLGGLVKKAEDWEYSSARDYLPENHPMSSSHRMTWRIQIKKGLAKEYLLI